MDIYVLNNNLELTSVITEFDSIIWSTRYHSSGDFEMTLPATNELLLSLQINNFIVRDEDVTSTEMKNVMIIKNIELKTDVEDGNKIIISGKSLSNIISQRIIANQSSVRGILDECIHLILIENLINPKDSQRKINNFIVEKTNLVGAVDIQATGDNVEEFINEQCEKNGIGYDVTIKNNKFVFKLYKGVDRSYNQTTNPFIVFSPNFDNLVNSDYQFHTEEYKNTAYVAGEGEGVKRRKITIGNESGLNRYEMWVDARDLNSNDGEIDSSSYNSMLLERGLDKLSESINNELFDCEAETTQQFKLNEDFFLGDIVQFENEYGISVPARIIEVIDSIDSTGRKIVPTFSNISTDTSTNTSTS